MGWQGTCAVCPTKVYVWETQPLVLIFGLSFGLMVELCLKMMKIEDIFTNFAKCHIYLENTFDSIQNE